MAKINYDKRKGCAFGRPTRYTEQLGDEICVRLMSGESLKSICRDEDKPHFVTVFRWLNHKDKFFDHFRNQYALARKIQAEVLADEMIDIVDDSRNDYMEKLNADGEADGVIFSPENVQRSKLRADSRKWILSRIVPRFKDEKESPIKVEAPIIKIERLTKENAE